MGTYLSTPVTEKHKESGEAFDCPVTPLSWGVVDMQGWRKTMEDAHVAQTDLMCEEQPAKVFGVFDGHGGPEVARFCSLYLVSVLAQQDAWRRQDQRNIGKALADAFHALDRMIDDESRRDELIRLRSTKPEPGERRMASSIPLPKPVETTEIVTPALESTTEGEPGKSDSPISDSNDLSRNDSATNQSGEEMPAADSVGAVLVLENGQEKRAIELGPLSDDDDDGPLAAAEESEDCSGNEADTEGEDDHKSSSSDDDEDDDSNEAVGKDQSSDDVLDGDDEDEPDAPPVPSTMATSSVTVMLRQLLSMSGPSGQATLQIPDQVSGAGPDGKSNASPIITPGSSIQSASLPSIVHNGRLICNLPDHPIHAGATAIVAVIVGRTLTVANAGDSRAVLCRAGSAIALSEDHKPTQDTERNRVVKAGGFVNQFGRVNGNLNLSRSIGDLKYKAVPGIPPSEQMITAEPDLLVMELEDADEFIILGCDGIWDCLTNERAVEYVQKRIDTKMPTEIGAEMLDEIISVDPRVTQGIGGDNMTVMIIDLKPQTRSYYKNCQKQSNE